MNAEKPEPKSQPQQITEATDTVLVVADGPEDTTIRKRRPSIPLTWPRPTPPEEKKPGESH